VKGTNVRRLGLFRLHEDQEGVTAIIIAFCLVALIGMIVLVVDVGGVLWKRRELVSGADAAALAAAKTCSVRVVDDGTNPETQADTAAINNVHGLSAANGGIIDNPWNCSTSLRTPRGYVTVQYTSPQQLFFAGIFGASTQNVTTAATAAWGPLGGGNAIPIVLESTQFQGQCDIPDVAVGQVCDFWYNNGSAAIGDANWGFLNLDQWNVSTSTNCNSAGGSSARGGYILNNFGSDLTLADPGPTYVCSSTGHATDNWQDLNDRMNGVGCKTAPCPGPIILMPVNDCTKQVDKSGNVVACGTGTPDKFAIIGFTTLQLSHIYKGNDPLAIGTPGAAPQTGDCGNNGTALGAAGAGDSSIPGSTLGGWFLPDFADLSCGAPRPPDSITPPVTVTTSKGKALVRCTAVTPSPSPPSCDYYYNPLTEILSWWNAATKDPANKVTFGWTVNGTPDSPGACPGPGNTARNSDPNAICLVMTWLGYTDKNGSVGTGPTFGTQGEVLCDFNYNSCPDGVKP
jgi:Flp pilus assembly protein TadG